MAFGRRRGRPNANGAGIAADPTLTGVWTSRSAWPFGLADFRRTFRRACFGGACLAPDVWPLRVRSCDPSHRDCSPALAPASGFRSCPAAPFRSPKPPMFAALRSRLAETVSFFRSGLAAVWNLRSTPSPVPARFAACPVALASLPLQTSWLAFGRSLLHAFSRRARGQLPPPSLGFYPRNFRALRLSVPAGWCPEDSFKVRLNRRSGNIPKP